jgi:hypothetical protein
MNYGLAEQNVSASKRLDQYFGALTEKLDEAIHSFRQEQKAFEEIAEPSSLITFETHKEQSDPRGQRFTEYRSSIALLRLYFNQPVGWIYGEIEQFVPWTASRKCFALSVPSDELSNVKPTVIGCYTYGEQLPNVSLLKNSIMEDLTHGKITLEQIEARSKVVEASRY